MSAQAIQIAVSYAWKEEASGPEARSVETLCTEIQQAGASVLRDTMSLSIGDNLRDFMRRIGTSEFLCVFLSDTYLRSANCMNELLIAWNHYDGKPEEFFKSVKVWVMPSASGIFGQAGRIVYAGHWEAEHKRQKANVKKGLGKHAAAADVDDLNRAAEYAAKVNGILSEIARRLAAPNFNDFKNWVCAQLPGNCPPAASAAGTTPGTAGTGGSVAPVAAASSASSGASGNAAGPPVDFAKLYSDLSRVFPKQVAKMEAILTANEALRAFLCGKHAVNESSATTQAAALVPRFFARWSDAIAHFSAAYEDLQDHEAVRDLTSNVLYLAMEPAYAATLQQPRAPIDIPVCADRKVVGGIEEILICWTRGAKPRVTSPSKMVEPFATPPQMRKDFAALKRDLMRLLDVDPTHEHADAQLEEAIARKERFRSPAYIHIEEGDTQLLDQIRDRRSPLKLLLVFILAKGATTRPASGNPIWDDNVERDFQALKLHLNSR